MTQYFASTFQFPAELEVGCLRLKSADQTGVFEYVFDADASEASITMKCEPPAPWDGDSLVMIAAHRLPGGKKEFNRKLEWYSQDRKTRTKLPDGCMFDPAQLVIAMPGDFEHAAFAQSNRSFVHTYISDEIAIIVRFLARKGNILDNPLFMAFLQNIEITDAWVSVPPVWQALQVTESQEQKPPRDIKMEIDLQKDAESVYAHILQRVASYGDSENYGPGEDDEPVTQITLGYQFDQAGWYALVFDTRPDAEIDGHWNDHIKENACGMAHWFEVLGAMYETGSPVTVIDHEGNRIHVDEFDESRFAPLFGEMLSAAMKKSLGNGVFEKLPLVEKVCLVVKEHSGRYGWVNEDIGK